MSGTSSGNNSQKRSIVARGFRKVKSIYNPGEKYPKRPFSPEYPNKWMNHIDITNHCIMNSCIYCSRYLIHVPENKRYHMSLEQIEEAIVAYKSFPEHIGIIGGEPQIHPQFKEICELLLQHNKKEKYGLFTSINPETSKYKDIIKKTFAAIAYNPHNPSQVEVCKHQPLTLAAKDMVPNQKLRNELYDQCYFRQKWCGTVTPLGAYQCEIAASIAYLIGQKGWPVKKGWWLRDWREQIDLCELCGGAIPQERQLLCNHREKVSPTIFKLLKDNDCILGEYELVTEPYTIAYLKEHATERPGAYRGDKGEIEQGTVNIDWSKYEA